VSPLCKNRGDFFIQSRPSTINHPPSTKLPLRCIDFPSPGCYFACMCCNLFREGRRILLFLITGVPVFLAGQTKTWTGNGGDGLWVNPANWLNATVPVASDDVVLDNGDLPGSYQVTLPDQAITVRTIGISPSPGNQIELILPASNILNDAVSITGPGYGLLLNSGAVFRNSSGIASGESLHIADSVRINSGGEYIHNTRASHAAGIVQILSSAPGTEKGTFVFDVPRASYTISVSNRIYGSLVLRSAGFGSPVNYTCSGSSPLRIQGDLRIGVNVNLSMNLNGPNGNIRVAGDFLQEGGTLNLASAAGNSSILSIAGNISQSPGSVITATGAAHPGIELNGNGLQLVAAGGSFLNGIVFRVNNPAGCKLLLPLALPYRMELVKGAIISSVDNLLTLGAGCGVQTDSTVSSAYVDGPLRKEGLLDDPGFLFPVGKNGSLRWLELKQATGNFTVEYRNEDPASLGGSTGTGIDHISKMEYWKVEADGPVPVQANMELSFVSPQSGGITDPAFLDVCGFSGSQWSDAGHTGITGDIIYGSVVSSPIADFSGTAFTLGSTVNLENPLPLTLIRFEGLERNGYAYFRWETDFPEEAGHFDLLEERGGQSYLMARIPAVLNQTDYSWQNGMPLQEGLHFYKLAMVGRDGNSYPAKTVSIKYSRNQDLFLCWSPASLPGRNEMQIHSPFSGWLDYRIISMTGQQVQQGRCLFPEGETHLVLPELKSGVYLFSGQDSKGKVHRIRFII